MKCDDCENYKAKKPGWTKCFASKPDKGTYSNDGMLGRNDPYYPRLTWLVKGYLSGLPSPYVRAGFQTGKDAELFLAALPEEER